MHINEEKLNYLKAKLKRRELKKSAERKAEEKRQILLRKETLEKE